MTSNTEVSKWQRFFVAAGIPSTVALTYSKSFAEQRIQFTMLDVLDKSVLIELGIVTVGDQIAILQHIRKLISSRKEPMDCSPSLMESNNITATKEKKASTAPDRDDIYHIHLPVGTTPKTRAILQKHSVLKSAGLLKRGSSGIRQSGKDILPSAKQNSRKCQNSVTGGKYSSTSMGASGTVTVFLKVSSTTDEFYGRLGIKGLVSDQLSAPRHSSGHSRANASSSRSLFERAINESTLNRVAEPIFRVRLSEVEKEWKPRSRISVPMRANFTGAIRKRRIESVTSFGNHALGNARQIVGRIRPSVFYRLG
uniref:SAM domain-containing protein n=1 Tax=Setaria digitata TaxID=48799 RepID=A0A915PW49_9BILA